MGSTVGAFGVAGLVSLQSVSFELAGGLQWEIVPGLHFGISVRTPGLLVGSQLSLTGTALSAAGRWARRSSRATWATCDAQLAW